MNQMNPARIACAFRAALHFLAKPGNFRQNPQKLPVFICFAIERAVSAGRIDEDVAVVARTIVMDRIAPSTTLNNWVWDKKLQDAAGHRTEESFNNMQEFRIRWLNELACEFFEKAPGYDTLRFSS